MVNVLKLGSDSCLTVGNARTEIRCYRRTIAGLSVVCKRKCASGVTPDATPTRPLRPHAANGLLVYRPRGRRIENEKRHAGESLIYFALEFALASRGK